MNPTPKVQVALLLLTSMVLLGIGLDRVHERHQLIEVGYKLSEARTALRALTEEKNRLRLEESVLTNPGRIERLATSMGMVRPSPTQMRIIPNPNSVALRK